MSFDLIKSEGLARAGILHTAHGDVKTPVFMPAVSYTHLTLPTTPYV